ncbi:FAD binding domain-containing protein [Xylariales sp. PMI_506]|nr:FAD binding domain-containing protein [Xylariales sp. PMI_506]
MRLRMLQFIIATLVLLATRVCALSACDLVPKINSSIAIELPSSSAYSTDQSEYWSTSCGDLEPTCILSPASTDQVVTIVQALLETNESFAIKSGGHNPNNYFASVAGGPLISTKNLNQVVLDSTAETVLVGPGNRWEDVLEKLDGSGYTVVGGRIGNVGVGGYMLGGGLSFMSSQYGFAANSVLEYTLVLANASVVTITPDNYPDIFKALTAGGNNYGIVTSYLLQAYPQGQIWGGNYFFIADNDTSTQLLAALRDFTEYYPDDKAGIILTSERTLATFVDLWIMFLFYNGPEPPVGVFDNFTAVGPTIDTTKTQSMYELISGNDWAVVTGSVYTIGTESTTLPSAENGAEVMADLYNTWVTASNEAALVPGLIASLAFQPVPKNIASAAQSKGGDLLDLDTSVDRIIMELDYSFWFNSDYTEVDQIMQDTYNGLGATVQKYQSQGKLPKGYLPLFMNDCFYRQDYWGRLIPENLELAQTIRDDLDPAGLWRDRTGGFKLPGS